MSRVTTIGACLAALTCAGPAHAATLSVNEISNGEYYRDGQRLEVTYTGSPTEGNRVTTSWDHESSRLVISDPGALAIVLASGTAATSCAVELKKVTCSLPSSDPYMRYQEYLRFDLGEGDDRAALTVENGGYVVMPTLDGGAGNDALSLVGSGSSSLKGGDGADTLTGGDGWSRLDGGAGADRLTATAGETTLVGGAGPDILTGGPGLDTVRYPNVLDPSVNGRSGVRITLDGIADDGFVGERDNALGAVEVLQGTILDDVLSGDGGGQKLIGDLGDDVLTGGDGADQLEAGKGDDRLDGGADDDRLIGGDGADRLVGGPGSDWVYGQYKTPTATVTTADADEIDVRDGASDHYACGNGADVVLADPLDAFGHEPPASAFSHPSECESVEVL